MLFFPNVCVLHWVQLGNVTLQLTSVIEVELKLSLQSVGLLTLFF